MRTTDVIVVGAGAAGLSAAATASEAGLSTILLESQPSVGGSSALSGGYVYAAGTTVQRAAGIEDGAEQLFSYLQMVSQGDMPTGLVEEFCRKSGAALEWLIGLGADFRPENVYVSGLDTIARSHAISGSDSAGNFGMGAELVRVLESACRKAGVEIRLNEGMKSLERNSDASGLTVRSSQETYHAGAVVLASGGFARNRDLVKDYLVSANPALAGPYDTLAGEGSTGGGFIAARNLGGAIRGHSRFNVHMAPQLLVNNFIYVNERGFRFENEDLYGSFRTVIARRQEACYAIFDEAARQRGMKVPGCNDETMPILWGLKQIRGMTRPSDVAGRELESHSANTLEDIAKLIGLPMRALANTVKHYNDNCRASNDRNFGRVVSAASVLVAPPFHAVRIRADTLIQTGTGLTIDRQARVLDNDGEAIAGLYAAGEVVAAHFPIYPASGMSLANCLVFGRIAGGSAAYHSRK